MTTITRPQVNNEYLNKMRRKANIGYQLRKLAKTTASTLSDDTDEQAEAAENLAQTIALNKELEQIEAELTHLDLYADVNTELVNQ